MSTQPAQLAPTAQPVEAENVSPSIESQPPAYPPMYPTGDQYRSERELRFPLPRLMLTGRSQDKVFGIRRGARSEDIP